MIPAKTLIILNSERHVSIHELGSFSLFINSCWNDDYFAPKKFESYDKKAIYIRNETPLVFSK